MDVTIGDRIETIEGALASVVYGEHEIGNLTTACAQLLEIVREQQATIEQQHERDQRTADALDELAGKISYLSTSPTEVREQLRVIAAIVRGEGGQA